MGGRHLPEIVFEEAPQSLDIGGRGFFTLTHLVRIAGKRVRPPGLGVFVSAAS